MNIIQKQPNPSGAYPPIQTWSETTPPETHYQVADDIKLTCGGFGTLTIENDIVTAFTGDTQAWEDWQASLPPEQPPTPTPQEDTDAMLVDHEFRLTLMELGV